MSFAERLRKLFSSPPDAGHRAYVVNVRCRRCGEVIPVRVDLQNDLSLDYDSGQYAVHKTVVGDGKNRCFQRVELALMFDANKQLLTQEAIGGEIITE
jgi:hypothetical protein